MSKDKYADLYMYFDTKEKTEIQEKRYKLRIVGLITDEEVSKLLKNNSLVKNVVTSPTISLKEIAKNESVEDLRIVGVIYSVDGTDINNEKMLFISERLMFISGITSVGENNELYQLSISGQEKTYIVITEIDTEEQDANNNTNV